MADQPDGRAVHDVVARAAGLRERSARRRRAWRAAPFFAALFLLVAVAGRLSGWPGALTLGSAAGLALLLAAYALLPRRTDVVTDAQAAALDTRAELGGELRSAHWFASQPANDAWVSYHLSRAADRIRATPWTTLYSPERMPRAYAITAAIAATALVITVIGPTAPAAVAPGVQRDGTVGRVRVLTAAEIERQLAALLATLESADTANARPATADEIRKLMDAVRESQRQNAGRPGSAIDEQLHQRLERAAQMKSLDPEIRDALQDLKQALAASREQNTAAQKSAGPSPEQSGTPQGDAAQASKSGDQESAQGQMVSDSQPGAGIGIVGMTNEPGTPPRDAGLGMGGSDGGSPNSGVMVQLGAALRRETLEASNPHGNSRLD